VALAGPARIERAVDRGVNDGGARTCHTLQKLRLRGMVRLVSPRMVRLVLPRMVLLVLPRMVLLVLPRMVRLVSRLVLPRIWPGSLSRSC